VAFAFNIEKWRKWLDGAQLFDADPFPTDLQLKWMEMESAGNACGVGKVENGHVFEAGLAQTYFETPTTVKYGVTSAQLRAKCSGTSMPTDLTDDDRRMHARVAVATFKETRAKARAKLSATGVRWSETSFDFWAFVKLHHALPALYAFLGPAKAAGAASSWATFRAYVLGLTSAQRAAISPVVAQNYSTASIAHWFDTCEEFASVKWSPSGTTMLLKLGALFGGLLALFGLAKGKGGGVASG
jgi:hypothetical protein